MSGQFPRKHPDSRRLLLALSIRKCFFSFLQWRSPQSHCSAQSILLVTQCRPVLYEAKRLQTACHTSAACYIKFTVDTVCFQSHRANYFAIRRAICQLKNHSIHSSFFCIDIADAVSQNFLFLFMCCYLLHVIHSVCVCLIGPSHNQAC